MKNKGFTLVELMVTVSIIGLLSVVVFANYRAGEKQFALQRSAHKLAQDIRRAQEMAMSAEECAVCGNIVPPRYGIYIHGGDSTFYQLLADIDDNGLFSYPHPGEDRVIETINYESGVYLKGIDVVGCSPSGPRRGNLTFTPPDPKTELWVGRLGNPPPHEPVECSEVILNLGTDVPGQTKSIRINQAGLIEIE